MFLNKSLAEISQNPIFLTKYDTNEKKFFYYKKKNNSFNQKT